MDQFDQVRETTIESYLLDLVRRLGGLCIKLSAPSDAGWPDRLIVLPGGLVGVLELKRPGKTPTRLQLYRIGQLVGLGLKAGWANSFAGVDRFIASMQR